MFYPDTFQISIPTDREIRITRDFDAPRQLVFDAFTKPELVRRWLLGPPRLDHADMQTRPKRGGRLPVRLA